MRSFETEELDRLARADRRKSSQFPLVPAGSGPDAHLRFEQLYFEDGSVVLISGTLRLKLHRTILAKYSGVFRDMLQVASTSAGETLEGCPIVHVTDDPQHLILFFNMIYDGVR